MRQALEAGAAVDAPSPVGNTAPMAAAAYGCGDAVALLLEAGAEANARGRWQADLYGLARRRLATLGVASVSGGDFCTFTDNQRFYSYRRDPNCGRMVNFIALRALEK